MKASAKMAQFGGIVGLVVGCIYIAFHPTCLEVLQNWSMFKEGNSSVAIVATFVALGCGAFGMLGALFDR
jgi:uncharacterized membrane protein